MATTDKEAVYDEKIFPLMEQILNICDEHKIAMLADFALGKVNQEDERQLKCTSFLLEGPFETDPEMIAAAQLLRPRKYMAALTITRNG